MLGLGALAMLLTACGGNTGDPVATPAGTASAAASATGDAAASPTGSTASPTPAGLPSPQPSPTGENIAGCVTADMGKIFKYTRDGTVTKGVIMGKGKVGAVVSYERRGTVCDWLPLAERLVAEGRRVLLFDRNDVVNPEKDTVEMARRLHDAGVEKVFLVGGSMGGRQSVLAAGMLKFPVAGVISVSGGTTLPEDVTALKAPFLQVTADEDSTAPLDQVQAVYEEAKKSADRQLLVLNGREHASALFTAAQGDKALQAITAFVTKHSR
ncbi:alpha/beta hydrolase [Streptosporangium sp. NPDC004379]|uniref:alpha/beta hydrolase n=1 Tax=Streptosporangium sp. NPDC004379 TaxID=3366189 RepID=UPI00368D55E4